MRGSNTRAAPHSRGQTTAGQPRRPAATSKAAARSTAGAPAKEQASSKAPAATATAAARAAKSTSHRRSTPSPASAATSVATAGGAAQPPRDNASRRSQTPPSDAKGGARPSSKQAEVNKDAALPKPMPKKRGGLASNGSQTKPGASAAAAPAAAAANATGVRSRSRSRSRSGSKGSKGSTGSSESTHKAPKARALTAVPPARAQPAAASKPPRPRSKSSRIAESALPTGGRAGGGKSGTSKGKAGGSSSRRGKNGRSNSSSMSKPGASDGAATRKPSHRGEGVKVKKPRKASKVAAARAVFRSALRPAAMIATLQSAVVTLTTIMACWVTVCLGLVGVVVRVHRAALSALCLDNHIWFAFAFLYAFPHVVALVIPWAPPWAPICLWYAFLVELFATQGPTAVVVTARVVLPLLFLLEGLSHHSFLLDLTGGELLVVAFLLSALKTRNCLSVMFMISLASQILAGVFLPDVTALRWLQFLAALASLSAMAPLRLHAQEGRGPSATSFRKAFSGLPRRTSGRGAAAAVAVTNA